MSKWKRMMRALLTAALLTALCLPASLADGSDANASGLDIEYDVVEPGIYVTDSGECDLAPLPADADNLAGTGLTPEGDDSAAEQTAGDPGIQPDGDHGGEALSPAPVELPEPEARVVIPEGGLDSEEAVAGFINKALYEQPMRGRTMLRAAFANTAGSRLTGAELRLYNALKPLVIEVAKGQLGDTRFELSIDQVFSSADQKLSYTAAELGLSSLYSGGQLSEDAVKTFLEAISPDAQKVMSALMADCPYEMFWFDKTSGIRWGYAKYQVKGETISLSDTGTVKYWFTVSGDYSATGEKGTFQTDAARIASIQTAAQNARRIVEDCVLYQDDLDKLTYYKNVVCSLADYNNDVVDTTPYGDPWQVIWVFDGDSSTRVVCEGYAKAFQYLCDQTTDFNAGITVTSVIGKIANESNGGGRHMWNLVNYNGVNYLADLTNCDDNCAGFPDLLFLKGYSYVQDGAYCFQLPGNKTLRYTFDDAVVNLYGRDSLEVSDDPAGLGTQGTALAGSRLAWSVSASGVLYIRGKGAIPDFAAAGSAPWAGSDVRHVSLSNGVTAIGSNAFTGCPNLTQVTIPTGVSSIADDAFDANAFAQADSKGLIIQTCASADIIAYCEQKQIKHTVNHGLTATDRAVEPTCTGTGLTEGSHCAKCGLVYVEQKTVPAAGHSWGAWNVAQAATCTAAGVKTRQCTRCTATDAPQAIPATGHSLTAVAAKAATCAATGNIAYWTCSACKKYFSDKDGRNEITQAQTVTAKNAGNHAGGTEIRNRKAATCKEAGYTGDTYCKGCGAKLKSGTSIAKLTTHTPKAAVRENVVAETCGRAGSYDSVVYCSVCGATLSRERKAVPATGSHRWGAWQTARAATCTAAGTQSRTCSVCGKTETQSVSATGHYPYTVWGYPATCTENGLTDGQKCSACNKWLTAQQVIPATGHNPVGVAGCPATYTSEGLTDGAYCANCGAWLTPQQVIPRVYIRQVGLAKQKNNGTIQMAVGESLMLVPQFAQDAQVAVTGYASSKANLASVDGGGIVTAHAEGKVKITVATGSKKVKATLSIKIVDPYKPTAVGIAQGKAVTVAVGQSIQLNANLAPASARATLTWSSNKPKVATVDGNGVVTPHGEGKAKITVKTHNKKKATITVTVVDPNKPAGVSIAQGNAVTIKVGQSIHLDAVLAPASAQSALTWKSSKPAIASVDGGGNVAAAKKGKARITVTTYNKKKATITVNVVE